MGDTTINGWNDVDFDTVALSTGVNASVTASQYLVAVPATNGDSITSFIPPNLTDAWMMEIANGDPGGTKSLILTGGAINQSPPQVVTPPGFSSVTILPGYAQRVIFIPDNTSWFPLFPGTLNV